MIRDRVARGIRAAPEFVTALEVIKPPQYLLLYLELEVAVELVRGGYPHAEKDLAEFLISARRNVYRLFVAVAVDLSPVEEYAPYCRLDVAALGERRNAVREVNFEIGVRPDGQYARFLFLVYFRKEAREERRSEIALVLCVCRLFDRGLAGIVLLDEVEERSDAVLVVEYENGLPPGRRSAAGREVNRLEVVRGAERREKGGAQLLVYEL